MASVNSAALRALDEAIPPHLRRNKHGENFLGERYATIRAALETEEPATDMNWWKCSGPEGRCDCVSINECFNDAYLREGKDEDEQTG